jgi:formylglycine-generating enzyme required for sulfatase activity
MTSKPILLLILAVATAQDPPPKRHPVPDKAVRDAISGEIRDLFRDEYAKRDPESRKAFAASLIDYARKTQVPDQRFTMFVEARDVAAEAGEIGTAFAAVDRIAAEYDVDAEWTAAAQKVEVLDTIRKATRSRETLGTVADAYMAVAREALESGDHDAAKEAADAARSAARLARKSALSDEAKDFIDLVEARRKEARAVQAAELKLSIAPDDPDANEAMGRFICFTQGDWERGLPFLAKGADADLKAVALKEMDKPEGADGCLETGEAWEAVSKKERDRTAKGRYLARALAWYERGLAGASGLKKLLLQKKVKAVSGSPLLEGTTPSSTSPTLVLDLGEGVTMDLVRISPGTFTMGSNQAVKDVNFSNAFPVHPVQITRAYYIGKTEVTCRQFEAFAKATGHQAKGSAWKHADALRDNLPAGGLSWNDAVAFCRWASARTRRTVRLPTEAEWEYACRAGTTAETHFDADRENLDAHAWHAGNGSGRLHPVGEKKPNPWGLHDMYGNAWEWVNDFVSPYPRTPARDPTGPATGAQHVLRGGSYKSSAQTCQSATRFSKEPGFSEPKTGFRVTVR